jgi:hypothetical protein
MSLLQVLKVYGDALAAWADLDEEEEEEVPEEEEEGIGEGAETAASSGALAALRLRESERDLLWLDLVQYLCAADPPTNPTSTLLDALNRYLSEMVLRRDVQR